MIAPAAYCPRNRKKKMTRRFDGLKKNELIDELKETVKQRLIIEQKEYDLISEIDYRLFEGERLAKEEAKRLEKATLIGTKD